MIIRRCLVSASWILLLIILVSHPSRPNLQALAQEPTAFPTPTPANTPTVEASTPTPTTGTTEPTPIPTSTIPQSTPNNRFIEFRVDDDEIESGECVRFSWIVKGDIGIVEFNEIDDNKDALLVSAEGNQDACPTKDTSYELIVTWLDNSRGGKGLTVELKNDNNGQSGNSSGSSSNNGQTSSSPGTFIAVTPIMIQTTSTLTAPGGIFSAARTLPETGNRSVATSVPAQAISVNLATEQPTKQSPISTISSTANQGSNRLNLWVVGLALGAGLLCSWRGIVK